MPHRPPRPEKSEGGQRFVIKSDFEPKGDQPQAITDIVEGVRRRDRTQVLLGVTGSGKTFTVAKVIEATQRPAIVLAPNKTLAAQLYGEFKSFFPDNAVEYFVSYYDYYQPEAYVPRTDTYIEKEFLDQRADRPHAPLGDALIARARRRHHRGVRVVHLRHRLGRDLFGHDLHAQAARSHRPAPAHRRSAVALHYKRSGGDFYRGSFRVHGDVVESFPAHYEDRAWRGFPVRRRDRVDPRVRSAHRPQDRRAGIREGLRQLALRDAAPTPCRRSPASRPSSNGGSTSSTPPGGCWKRSAWSSARSTISR